jgi:hypothetical protein
MKSLGAYELLEEIGRGGAGRVFRARHVPTGAIRAVKVLGAAPEPESAARFRREAEALARVGGTGVVTIHETSVDGGQLYLVMELMPGGSLEARLKARGALPWREAAALVAELARALERCHATGLLHRDVKPANVLFDEGGRPRLADFGCVRDLSAATLTETGTVLGTPAYMSPEQLSGEKVDARADVYSLGVILHELVAGVVPYPGRSLFELHKQAMAGARRPLGVAVPAALESAIERALAPRRDDRFGSAALLALALEKAEAGAPARTRRVVPALVALVALVAVATGVATRLSRPPVDGLAPRTDEDARAFADALQRAREVCAGAPVGRLTIEHVATLARRSAPELDDVAQQGAVYDLEAVRRIRLANPAAPGIRLLEGLAGLAARRAGGIATLRPVARKGDLAERLLRAHETVDRFVRAVTRLTLEDRVTGLERAPAPGLAGLKGDLGPPLSPAVVEGLLEPAIRLVRRTLFVLKIQREGASDRTDCDQWATRTLAAFEREFGAKGDRNRLPPRLLLGLELEEPAGVPREKLIGRAVRREQLAVAVEADDAALALAGHLYALVDRNWARTNTDLTEAYLAAEAAIDARARRLLGGAASATGDDRVWFSLLRRDLDAVRRSVLRAAYCWGGRAEDARGALDAGRAVLADRMFLEDGTELATNRDEDVAEYLKVVIETRARDDLAPGDVALVKDDLVLAERARGRDELDQALAAAERLLQSPNALRRSSGRAVEALIHAGRREPGARKELEALLAEDDYGSTLTTLSRGALEKALEALGPPR